MALAHVHELYVAHVGDSRAYWITRTGCYQVTLDDDVACREVRLGYALYRDALEQVAAGALIQALGITSSNTLHPTVQRFPVDEDCVLLLCSDGLSDKDRVEECWETEILPILDGSIGVAAARDRLIEIANTKNGHDNVTIGLIHCQAHLREEGNTFTELSIAAFDQPSEPIADSEDVPTDLNDRTNGGNGNSQLKTEFLQLPDKNKSPFSLLLKIVFLLGLGGVFAYFFIPPVGRAIDAAGESILGKRSVIDPQSSPQKTQETLPSPIQSLETGSFVEIKNSAVGESGKEGDRFYLLKKIGEDVKVTVPAGSVLQVTNKQVEPEGNWLELKVCSIPEIVVSTSGKPKSNKDFSGVVKPETNRSPVVSTPSPSPAVKATVAVEIAKLQAGEMGWIQEKDAVFKVVSNPVLNSNQQGKCLDSEANPNAN